MATVLKLKELGKIITGNTPRVSDLKNYSSNDINFVKPSDFLESEITYIDSSEFFISEYARYKSRIVPSGSILVTCIGNIGKVGITQKECAFNQQINAIIPDTSKVIPSFLAHILLYKKSELNNLANNAVVPIINKKEFSEFKIHIPSIKKQKKIACKLDFLKNIISLRQKQLSKLDQLVKSRFIEMFGDENYFQNWPTCKIGDIAKVYVGIVIKPSQYYTSDIKSGIKAFRSLNIGEMYIKNNDWVYFTKEGHQKNPKSIIKENDVLIVRSGSPGTACVATKEYAGYNAIDIIIAHPNCKKINPIFLAMFTNMPHGMNQIRKNTGGAAQQHFNVGEYKNITIILPPLPPQEQFAAFVQQVDKSKLAVKQSLEKLETLKKSLMQDYFG